LLGSREPKPSRKANEGAEAQCNNLRVERASEQEIKWQKVPMSSPWGAIYGEEEAVVYIYSIGRVEYYMKIPGIFK